MQEYLRHSMIVVFPVLLLLMLLMMEGLEVRVGEGARTTSVHSVDHGERFVKFDHAFFVRRKRSDSSNGEFVYACHDI